MKEYEILFDAGEARNLVAEMNRMAMEGWEVRSIGAIGAGGGFCGVHVLMEREKG